MNASSVLSRRALLAASAAALAPAPAIARTLPRGMFTHGVASGDPTADSIILWTRFVAQDASAAKIGWEIAEDDAFARIAARGIATARPQNDYCAKADVRGLKPGRRYFYRFLAGNGPSPTGLTRTAPQGDAQALTLGVFACANLPFGYFRAYADAATRDDIDVCVHLGDYIYEIKRGSFPGEREAVPGRLIEPAGEAVHYADYCARYASYRADPDLQELHRLKPWAAIWDDHEFNNDAWMDGALNHVAAKKGSWAERKAAAAKAFLDWLPIRERAGAPLSIYRRLDWGNLATLLLLDARLIGRDRQFNYWFELHNTLNEGGDALKSEAETFRRDRLMNPQRSMLGAAQEHWLSAELARSKARGAAWQVLAQQVVMGDHALPPGFSALLPDNASAFNRNFAARSIALGKLGLPWNPDNWGGYPPARRRLLEACAQHASNALVLSGDSHNFWAFDLPGAVELAVGGVTSPGLERTFSNASQGERERLLKAANAELAWCNIERRGYATTRITRTGVESHVFAFDNVAQNNAPISAITKMNAATGERRWAIG